MTKKKKLQIRNSTAEFLIFTNQAKEDGIEVRVQDETIWLSQKLMGTLFDCSTDNISLHLHVAEEVAAGKNLVVIFDELFKGTNVKDAYDATVAVTEAFSAHSNCSYIISTHITEAGHTLREKCKNFRFVYLPTIMQGAIPTYTYRLQEGITNDRHGMMIIQNEHILDIIRGGKQVFEL